MATTPPATRAFEAMLKGKVRSQYGGEPLTGPLILEVLFTLRKQPSIPKKRTLPSVKPDADNLLKALKDSLEGVLWVNDSQIVTIYVRKVYGREGAIKIRVGETDDGILMRYT